MRELVQYVFETVRFWSVNGLPVEEKMSIVYAPTDWRAFELPPDLWAIHGPAVQSAVDSYIALTGLDPENDGILSIVENGWLAETRSLTGYGIVADPGEGFDRIWTDIPQDQVPFWDFISRPIRPGISALTFEDYTDAVTAIEDALALDVATQVAADAQTHNDRYDTLALAIGPDAAAIILGAAHITAEQLTALRNPVAPPGL